MCGHLRERVHLRVPKPVEVEPCRTRSLAPCLSLFVFLSTIKLTWKRIALTLLGSSAIYKSPAGTARRQGWIIKHFAV